MTHSIVKHGGRQAPEAVASAVCCVVFRCGQKKKGERRAAFVATAPPDPDGAAAKKFSVT